MFYTPFITLALLVPCAFARSHEFDISAHGDHAQAGQRETKKVRLVRKDAAFDQGRWPWTAATESSSTAQPLPDPVNFVINCPEDVNRLARFRKHMDAAGLTFEVFPCIKMSHKILNEAIRDGFLGYLAQRGDIRYSGLLGVALAHMKLLHLIISRNIPAANIFEDDEVVYSTYHKDRQQVLASLPSGAEFVNLNPRDPRGDPVEGTGGKLLRMSPGIPLWSNIWLSNYFVSLDGAKTLLGIMKRFDLGPNGNMNIDWYVTEVISSGCGVCHINAYAYATNTLSMHCENTSVKEKQDREGMKKQDQKGMLLAEPQKKATSLASRDPIAPVCLEGDTEGLAR